MKIHEVAADSEGVKIMGQQVNSDTTEKCSDAVYCMERGSLWLCSLAAMSVISCESKTFTYRPVCEC